MTRVETQKFYESTAWKHTALAAKVRDSWLCVTCRRAGLTVAAEAVHHVKAIKDGGAKLLLDNTVSLCREHHESLHGRAPDKQKREWTQYLSRLRKTI